MSDYKPRYTNRYDISMDGIYSLDLPNGTYQMIDKAFKQWEVRRGFITEEQQKLGLRGRAYRYGEFAKKKKQEEEAATKPKVKAKKTVKKKIIKKKIVAKKKIKKVVKKK